jgi:hypothetical protein
MSRQGFFMSTIRSGVVSLPYTPPLDLYPGAEVAYSTRLVRSDYTGPLLRIKNSISLVETDIFPDGTGFFDKAAVISATTTGIANVLTIYDQSGNGYDLTANNVTITDIYDSSTGFYVKNGKETIFVNGTFLSTGAASFSGKFLNAGPKSFFTLVHTRATAGTTLGIYFAVFGSSSGWIQRANFTQYLFANLGGTNLTGNPSLAVNTDYLFGLDQTSGSVVSQYLNGTLFNTGTRSTPTVNGNELRLGDGAGLGSTTSFFKECIGYNSDQSANRTGIEANINSYF